MDSSKPSLARLKIAFPEKIWINTIFKEFKDITMKIEYFLPYDLENLIGNSVVEIQHYKIDEILNIIKSHESVKDMSVLEREENKIVLNVKTQDPYLLYGVIKFGVLIDFPVRVKEGNAYWKLISTRSGIDELLSYFEKRDIDFELLRIGNSPYDLKEKEGALSLDESKILQIAIDSGFFEIPREISLEELANKLGKSKSALSVMLRKIIKKKVMIEA